MRLTKIVTKTGDAGKTSLGSGEKVEKDDLRIHLLGELDELNSLLGWVRISLEGNPQELFLKDIQNDIFDLGGQISMLNTDMKIFSEEAVLRVDSEINALNAELSPLKEFILPGGSESGARIHIARSVCRRVERTMVSLAHDQTSVQKFIPYINRLSDYLFVLSRAVNKSLNSPEDQWSR